MKNRRDRGAALLLILAAVALLTVLAVDLASRAGADSLRARRSERDAAFRRAFESAAATARGLLAEPEPAEYHCWSQSWNRELRLTLEPSHEVVVRLFDENGKLNLARAITHPDEAVGIRDRLRRLVEFLSREPGPSKEAWKALEGKMLRRLESREPLESLDGLRETGLELSTLFGSHGLSRYLTCSGDGRINLNTATRAVLYAIDPEFDDAMVERIAGYRGKSEGDPGPYKPFEEPQDLMLVEGIVNRSVGSNGELRVTRNLYEKVQGLICTKSSCFSARIEAIVDGKTREAWAFLKADGSRLALEEIRP